MKNRSATILLASLVYLPVTHGSARAQANTQATKGFPLADGAALHADVSISTLYDTNPGRVDPEQTTTLENGQQVQSTEQPDARLVIRPGLSIEFFGPKASLDFSAHANINRSLGLEDSQGSTDPGGDIGVDFAVGKGRAPVGFELKNTFIRTPVLLDEKGSISADEFAFPAYVNVGEARFVFRPGGGALELRTGYRNQLLLYDTLPSTQLHGGTFEARYRFLPKTALIVSAELSGFDATPGSLAPTGEQLPEASAETRKATPLNVMASLRGQLTSKVAVTLGAGYGNALTTDGDFFEGVSAANSESVIAEATIEYRPIVNLVTEVGFQRDVAPIVLLDSYVGNSGFLSLDYLIGGRLSLGASGSIDSREYGRSIRGDRRDAIVYSADASVSYQFFPFLTGGLDYRVINQSSEGPADVNQLLLGNYTRHQVIGSAQFSY